MSGTAATSTASSSEAKDFTERTQPWATLLSWVKATIVSIVAVVAAVIAAYSHFATAKEVNVLRCSLLRQNKMNAAVAQANAEMKVALKVFRGELLRPSVGDGQRKNLAANLVEAIANVEKAMDKVETLKGEMALAPLATGSDKCDL